MKQLIGVYGASGFGKQVMPLIARQFSTINKDCFVFIDDSNELTELNGYKVLTYHEFLKHPSINKRATIAIANSQVRELLSNRLAADHVKSISVKSETSVILDEGTIYIAEGSVLCSQVCLTSSLKIGKFFHANMYSYVTHDCIIGDYVTFAPRVSCNGNVHIHDHAYIGTGAVIKQGRPDQPLIIGEGAVVGMGAVVTKSVPAGAVVIGNPARPLAR